MLPHMVEIAGDNRHLCKEQGFLAVYEGRERLGRIPLDDLSMVLVCGHGVTWSNDLLVALGEACVPVVLCGRAMRPVSLLWSLQGHHLTSGRIRSQADAGLPARKQIWRSLVSAKIRMQAQHVALRGGNAGHLEMLARGVRSGDADNAEATAARLYWALCFGPEFRRDRESPGVNALLNYGYTVLRAAVARAVMLAGLHPAFGVFHCNARNPMPLVDDLMEPFRPVADMLVLHVHTAGHDTLTPPVKQVLATLTAVDIRQGGVCSTVGASARACADSFAAVLAGERKALEFPEALVPLKAGNTPWAC